LVDIRSVAAGVGVGFISSEGQSHRERSKERVVKVGWVVEFAGM
jgi:hypothetical protein